MRKANDIPNKDKIEAEQAFRRGYDDAVSGRIQNRDQSPFHQPVIRKHWKRGFDLAQKGLKIKLPAMTQ